MGDSEPLTVTEGEPVHLPGGDIPTLHARGELDTAGGDGFLAAVRAVVDAVPTASHGSSTPRLPVVVSLDDVTFVDSSGLSSIISAVTRAAQQGVSLRLVAAPGSAVHRLVRRVALVDLLALHDTLAEAADGRPSRLENEVDGEEPGSGSSSAE